jgi:phospholipase/carboxylesterase
MNRDESAASYPAEGQALPVLETVERCSAPNPSASVIWLHGLGADGHDFEALIPQLAWPGAPAIRYVFPHAPVRPVTVNGGMQMRAWYDILSIESERDHDRHGIADSVRQVEALVARECERGIPSSRIILAGFSQGGAIALQLALSYPHKLAGLIALSSYLLFDKELENRLHEVNRDTAVFVGHGTMDPMVPLRMGKAVYRRLQSLDYPVEWHSYPMPHAICPEEVEDITAWLKERLG